MSENSCGTCRFWKFLEGEPPVGDQVSKEARQIFGDGGICHRNAPLPIAYRVSHGGMSYDEYIQLRISAIWPRTQNDDWCGQYEN